MSVSVSVCAMVEPLPAAWPVTLPVTVPIVQANVEPAGEDAKDMVVAPPEQIVAEVAVVTVGFGLTVTVIVVGEPAAQPLNVGVTIY